MKTPLLAALLAVLALTGCGDDVDDSAAAGAGERVAAGSTAEEPEALIEAPEAEAPTGPGEICDIASMYTVDCHKQFPDVAYLNGIERNAVEPLSSMSETERLELGALACEQMRAGTASTDIRLVADAAPDPLTGPEQGVNDRAIVGVAIASYCVEFDSSGMFD